MKEIVNDFYNCYSYKISCIKSMEDKNNILSEMQDDYFASGAPELSFA